MTGSHSAYAVCKRFEVIEPHSCVEGAVCKNVRVRSNVDRKYVLTCAMHMLEG